MCTEVILVLEIKSNRTEMIATSISANMKTDLSVLKEYTYNPNSYGILEQVVVAADWHDQAFHANIFSSHV